MLTKEYEIRAFDVPHTGSYDLYLTRRTDNKRLLVRNVSVQEVEFESTAHLPGPTIQLDPDMAQALMNELWRVGLRPKDGASSMAHTEALKYHLEDMRRLVFQKVN